MFAFVLLAMPAANAWEHTGLAWAEEDFPLSWQMYTTEEDSLPEGYSLEVLELSWAAWLDAECAAISSTYDGQCRNQERNSTDGQTTFHWDDPSDEMEPGVLGVTYSKSENVIVKETSTRVYKHVADADIVFNNNVDFSPKADIESSCSGEMDIQGVATHEIGHLHGLAHSCEEGAACAGDQLDATMYWSVSSCDTSQSDINQDDISSISSLYGKFGTFVANSPRYGAAPLAVEFEVQSDTEVVGARWTFGDGEASEEINPTHEYMTAGQFTVQVEIDLEDPTCGISTYTYDELGFVLVCTEPVPADGATGFFTLEHSDGLTWQTVNHSDVTVYGCIDTIAWEVYTGTTVSPDNLVDLDGDGEGDQLGAWAPKIAFPGEGTYTVVMNVGGPGGLKASQLTVEVVDRAAEGQGCSSTGTGGFAFAGIALAAAAGLRRRRA